MLNNIKLDFCTVSDGRIEVALLFDFDQKQIDIMGKSGNLDKYFNIIIEAGERQSVSFSDLKYTVSSGQALYNAVIYGDFSDLALVVECFALDKSLLKQTFAILEENNLVCAGFDVRTNKRDQFLQKTASITDILNYNSEGVFDFPDMLVQPMWEILVRNNSTKMEIRFDKKDGNNYIANIFIKKFDYSADEVLTLFNFHELNYLFYKGLNYFEGIKQTSFYFDKQNSIMLDGYEVVEDAYLGECFKFVVSHEVDLAGVFGDKFVILSLDYFLNTVALVNVVQTIIQNLDSAYKIVSSIELQRGVGLQTRMINFDVANKFLPSYNKYIDDARKDLVFVAKMLNFYKDINVSFLFDGLVIGRQTIDKLYSNFESLIEHMTVLKDVLDNYAMENMVVRNIESENFVKINE